MPTLLRPDLPPEIDDVFRRVLSKQPGDRYQSCREFIDAARVALGIPGRATGSLEYGVTTAALDASTPGHGYAAAPVGPGSIAAASPSASPSGPPRGPRWYRQPRWIAALAALILVVAGLGTWAGLRGSHAKASTMPSMSARPTPKPANGPLMKALIVANQSNDAKGQLPPSTCKQDTQTHVTCTAPALGVNAVVFQTYPSLKALYAAYTAKVSSVNSGQFKQDFNDCGFQATFGEVGWNHLFQHTRKYTVDQMTTGMVKDDQAAGRVFCNYTQGLEYMVWTQNDGRMMGYVAGPVHANVWNWWVAVHHNIGIGGAPMNMNM